MNKKIYLASRYTRRLELCEYRAVLEGMGYTVTSRWLNGAHEATDNGLSDESPPELRARFAVEDWDDVMSADIMINFTEPSRSKYSRGGRHVKFGAALAVGKTCIVVGPRENVFHCMPGIYVFDEIFPVYNWLNLNAQAPDPIGDYAALEKDLVEITDDQTVFGVCLWPRYGGEFLGSLVNRRHEQIFGSTVWEPKTNMSDVMAELKVVARKHKEREKK